MCVSVSVRARNVAVIVSGLHTPDRVFETSKRGPGPQVAGGSKSACLCLPFLFILL